MDDRGHWHNEDRESFARRFADAERIRKWLGNGHGVPSAAAEESHSNGAASNFTPKVTS